METGTYNVGHLSGLFMHKSALKIPKEDQPGFSFLCKIDESAFRDLLDHVSRSPSPRPVIKGLTSDESDQVWSSLNAMHIVRQRYEVDLDEFTSDIIESLKKSDVLPQSEEHLLRERLLKVLAIDALIIDAKSITLGNEHENRFCEARIFTDLRPVFGTNLSDPSRTMIISHQLKISYHRSAPRSLHAIYIALGLDDLKELRSLLDREEQKINNLKSSLAASDITFVDADHQGDV